MRIPTWTRRADEVCLHDARERAGMGKTVAVKLVVEIRMRVELEHG